VHTGHTGSFGGNVMMCLLRSVFIDNTLLL
jgi:hypothetical protein